MNGNSSKSDNRAKRYALPKLGKNTGKIENDQMNSNSEINTGHDFEVKLSKTYFSSQLYRIFFP